MILGKIEHLCCGPGYNAQMAFLLMLDYFYQLLYLLLVFHTFIQSENCAQFQMCRVFEQFFRGVFGRARCYLDWLCCVALRFVVCFVLCCVDLWCDVMCCDVSYLLLYFVGLKFLSFPVPSLHDSTQQLDGHTTVRPARPTRQLNKQNVHCVFSTGKHRFLHGIFVITTFYLPSVALVKLAKISSLSLTSTFWWPFHMLKRIANLKGAP